MTAKPSNSTGTNGNPAGASGMIGCTGAISLTLNVPLDSGSASRTSIAQTSSPVSLSRAWTKFSRVDRSKSRTGSTPPLMYAP